MNDNQPIRVIVSSQGEPSSEAIPAGVKHLARREQLRGLHVTPRDRAILEALARHRFLTSHQLQCLVFGCGMSRVRRRLRQLYDGGYLERIRVMAEPTYGIPSFVYQLTARGLEVIEGEVDLPARIKGLDDVGPRFVRHHCLLTDFCIALHQACRPRGLSVSRWLDEFQLKHVLGEPPKVTVAHQLLGDRPRQASYLPDALASLSFPDGRSLVFFVEIDLSTHAQRHWVERALVFSQYVAPNGWLTERLKRTCRLLIITKPDFRRRSRCANVLQSIQRAVGPTQLFLATTLDNITPARVLASVWRAPGQEQTCSLLPQSPPSSTVRVRVGPSITAAGHTEPSGI